MKTPKPPIEHVVLTPHAMTPGGRAIAKLETGKFCFIPKGLPGQTVEVRPKRRRKSFTEARVVEIIEHAPYEMKVPYQRVPGAPWISVPLEKQHEWKVECMQHVFEKFAKTDITPVLQPLIPSPISHGYRNKMELSFGPTHGDGSGFGLGSKASGSFWRVESLHRASGLFDPVFEEILPKFREWCEKTKLPVYHQKMNKGFWRHVAVRKSFAQEAFLVLIVTSPDGILPSEAMTKWWKSALGEQLAGLLHVTTDAKNDSLASLPPLTVLHGKDELIEEVNGLSFQLSAASFFQPNPTTSEFIYEKVLQHIDPKGAEKILDVCCGTGTIGQIIAHHMPQMKVTGIEIVQAAVDDARANATRNNLDNVDFVCADVKHWIRAYQESADQTPVQIVLDPPRSGISPKVLAKIATLPCKNLVYVSCNPGTMARDAVLLMEAGYVLQSMTPIDQFPHTPHVEVVGHFTRA